MERKPFYLSPAYERFKAHRDEYAAEHSGAHTMGYLAAMDWCIASLKEEAENAPPMYLRRPSKAVFTFNTEEPNGD